MGNNISMLRTMAQVISRFQLRASTMFDGKRDFYQALGYRQDITFDDYFQRYERGDIAARIIEAYPDDTWRDGAEILEVEDAKVETEFEKATASLLEKTNLWTWLLKADVLAGIGEYAVLLIGAPGESLAEELPKGKPGDVKFFRAYAQKYARVLEYEQNEMSERFGEPLFYELSSTVHVGSGTRNVTRRVHWTRVIDVVDGALTGPRCGTPRLKKVWNRLDNLETVVGGGSEAFWKTVFQGMQLDMDKDVEFEEPELEALSTQIDEFEHNLRRVFRTRGVKANMLGADVSDFSPQARTILALIAATTKIPQRMLLGSERGELASSQDAREWDDRIASRRSQWAAPIVRSLVERLTTYGYLPTPQQFFVRWPTMTELTLTERATIVGSLSKANAAIGEMVVTGADLRDKVLGWEPLPDDVLDRGVPDPTDADSEDEEDDDEEETP